MARRVFYSFHYKPDVFRVSQIRNIGKLEANSLVEDNDWEIIIKGGDTAIKRWISSQMERRTCTIVLIGHNTANRKWINYEINQSWEKEMGVVGIYIHGLEGTDGKGSRKGKNPFYFVKDNITRKRLSGIVKCYNPTGRNSRECYRWIEKNLGKIVEEAIKTRKKYSRLSKILQAEMRRRISS